MSVPAQSHAIQTSPIPPPRIDFKWIGQAWTLASAQLGVWVGAMLLYFLISVAIWLLLAIPTGALATIRQAFKVGLSSAASHSVTHPYAEFAAATLLSILLAGLCAILSGGLYRMALRQKRGEAIAVFGLFSAFSESLSLFLLGIVVPTLLALIESAALWLLHFRLSPAVSTNAVNQADLPVGTLLSSLLMFAPLLIVDTGTSVPEALLGSLRLLGRQWLRGIGFYIAASFAGGVGLLLCGVGMLATYPVFPLSIAAAYLALAYPSSASIAPVFDPPPAGVWPPPPRVPQENQTQENQTQENKS